MKSKFLALIAITALCFTACKKDVSVIPVDEEVKLGDTYQPFTRDSKWIYYSVTHIPGTLNQTRVETNTITMNGMLYLFDQKEYHIAKSSSSLDPNLTDVFLGLNNGIYSTRETDDASGQSFEMPYLNPDVASGTSWITAVNLIGVAIQMQLKTTVMEKGISRLVKGKNYENVIHSQVEVQYKINNAFQTMFYYDFYVAKGIGMIAFYTRTPTADLTSSELTSYTIK
jgi:hypothetical protein